MKSGQSITGFLDIDTELLAIARGDGSDGLSDEEILIMAKHMAERVETRINAYIESTLSEPAFDTYVKLAKDKASPDEIMQFLKKEISNFDARIAEIFNDITAEYRG